MRRPTLERWLRGELVRLSELERFSLRKLAAMAQGSHARLVEPLFLYCHTTRRLASLYELIYQSDFAEEYQHVEDLLAGQDLFALSLSGKAAEILPAAYAKHLNSFAAAYRKQDTDAESKRLRQQRCVSLQLQKGTSTASACKALGLDPGNVCAFLKQGDLGRLTLSDATALMKYLASA